MLERKEGKMMWVPGNVPSLKNSKVKTSKGIFSSPTVNKYLRSIGIQGYSSSKKTVKGYKDPSRKNLFEMQRPIFDAMLSGKEYPLVIGIHQIRNSKRAFDFSNSVEIIQDLLVAHDFIEDDNVRFMFPMPMTIDGKLGIKDRNYYSVDKEDPGFFLKVF